MKIYIFFIYYGAKVVLYNFISVIFVNFWMSVQEISMKLKASLLWNNGLHADYGLNTIQ